MQLLYEVAGLLSIEDTLRRLVFSSPAGFYVEVTHKFVLNCCSLFKRTKNLSQGQKKTSVRLLSAYRNLLIKSSSTPPQCLFWISKRFFLHWLFCGFCFGLCLFFLTKKLDEPKKTVMSRGIQILLTRTNWFI